MKKGWQTRILGEVCAVDKCQGFHKNLPYVGLEHIEAHTGRFIGSIEPLVVKSSTFKFSPEHILYGRLRPYLNKVMLPDFTGHCSTEIFPLKPRPGLLREFLQYWFLRDATVEQIDATSTGARMPRANMNTVLDFAFPLPPFPEQQRIVGILDEAFEGIATAKATAEKNLQNARALFESHLQSIFTQRGPEWVVASLGDVCETTQGVQIPKNLHFKSPGTNLKRYLYISDFEHDENKKYVEDIYPKKRVTEDDLIVVNTGATAGKIFRGINGVLSNNLFKVILNAAKIDCNFLYYFVTSSLFKNHQKKIVKGAANPHMGHENFKSTPISIPSLTSQLDIVVKLDTLSTETECLASLYERKLAALESLKRSLLNQAFTGQL